MKVIITSARDWYGRYERPVSSLSLIIGFVFEWSALKRIDMFWENIWVAAHFFIIALLIILVNFQEEETTNHKDASRIHFWYLTFLQGFFGGLLSTFLVFYFRSATLAVSWPFLLLLSAAFVAHESFKKHYERVIFQLCLFYLSLLAFAIYIVPVFFHRIGPDVFLISGLISLVSLLFFVAGVGFFAREKFRQSKKTLAVSVLGLYFAVNILYFFNIIPPIPLSLKDAGVYHSLYKNTARNYVVGSENTAGSQNFFAPGEDIHLVAGRPVYVYSAIFSPSKFNTGIVHEWQKYDENAGQWATATRVNLSASGGREGGYRVYSMKTSVVPGEWRVNVKTMQGQVIGRLRFNVFAADPAPPAKD